MFTKSFAYRVRIMSTIALFALIFSQLYIPIASATTNAINFATPSNYTYDTNKILASEGALFGPENLIIFAHESGPIHTGSFVSSLCL